MDNREANFAEHPPYCTCVDCTNTRLKKLKGVEIPRLQKCHRCKRTSLFWNKYSALFECLNPECKNRFTPDDLSRETAETKESETPHDEQTHQALKQPELLDASSSETKVAFCLTLAGDREDTIVRCGRHQAGKEEIRKMVKNQVLTRSQLTFITLQ